MGLWIFDNDGTLYDDFGAGKQFVSIFHEYYSKIFDVDRENVPAQILKLKDKWKTEFSVIALMRETGMEFEEIVKNTYLKINLLNCNIKTPDIEKLKVLNGIRSTKVVYTNNPSLFAKYVLSYVGLFGCFVDIIGIEEMEFNEKPNLLAYQHVLKRHPGYNKIFFCDDSLQNLKTARELGWTTIWRKPRGLSSDLSEGHIVIDSFEDLLKIT